MKIAIFAFVAFCLVISLAVAAPHHEAAAKVQKRSDHGPKPEESPAQDTAADGKDDAGNDDDGDDDDDSSSEEGHNCHHHHHEQEGNHEQGQTGGEEHPKPDLEAPAEPEHEEEK
ncbi:RNA polymerase-associated protein LEO1-like [Topomyia yanbarensis]|uniref:RNA polymerase-associated protein LEO1-like n=1 Tax=Topomyia yanbarensis TaxID=2498891 RepID=UPI00273AF967|nr:RNA polymerase-associated protein LEO1-like [Topomyia yanbarensis]